MTPNPRLWQRLKLGLLALAIIVLGLLLLAVTGQLDVRTLRQAESVEAAPVLRVTQRAPISGTPEPITFSQQLTGTPTASPSPTVTIGPTDTPLPTATSKPTITPTRPPDIFVERFMRNELAQVIPIVDAYNTMVVNDFRADHTSSVALSWGEAGLLLNRQPIQVDQFERLTIYYLGNQRGERNELLDATFEDNVTRITGEQVFFPEHRMQELLYWLVRHGAEEGGQFAVVVEEFSFQQSQQLTLTLTDFTPFQTD